MFDKVGLTVVCVEVIVLAVERVVGRGLRCGERKERGCVERRREERSNREMKNVKSTYLHRKKMPVP
jgi:hypothetical protein